MMTAGQIALLAAFVASGFAAWACFVGSSETRLRQVGVAVGVASVVLLTGIGALLGWALVVKDFRFAYVAECTDRLLPWYYSLAAIWVGQAGSLLTWAWLLGVLAVVFRFWPGQPADRLRDRTYGVLMACLCFLVAIMVFAADPMRPSLGLPQDGAGLSPLLQHPAMLLHPPVMFLGYAGCTVPFALAVAALWTRPVETGWVRRARPWVAFSWAALGGGILLGAYWAYEELSWGGYWIWDPVENGSLIPWLTVTALAHTAMAWQYRGMLKKTTVALAVGSFALCNFATFLTRSGVFDSVHAFSESPIGWMFLVLMFGLSAGGAALIVLRRAELAPDRPILSVWSRESMVMLATLALLLLGVVTTAGTIVAPVSNLVTGTTILLAPPFYNNVMIPIALLLLAMTAAAPLLRWAEAPAARQRRALLVALAGSIGGTGAAWGAGVRHPLALAVAAGTAATLVALAGALLLDALHPPSRSFGRGLWRALQVHRIQYAGFLIHLGFVCLAVGVAGSSLGTHRHEAELGEGETTRWAGQTIRYVQLVERHLADKILVEAQLAITRDDGRSFTVLPTQSLYRQQDFWTTQVGIHSTWGGDFYAVLQGFEGDDRAAFTFQENPLMRWLWLSGVLALAGTLLRLWPTRKAAPAGKPR